MLFGSQYYLHSNIKSTTTIFYFQEYTGKDLEMKELGFHTLVQLLERVAGVRVMKPPDAGFMMVYGPKEKRKKKVGGGPGVASSSDGCRSSENEEV